MKTSHSNSCHCHTSIIHMLVFIHSRLQLGPISISQCQIGLRLNLLVKNEERVNKQKNKYCCV